MQDSPKKGGKKDPLAGMHMSLGMRKTCRVGERSSTFVTPNYPYLASCSPFRSQPTQAVAGCQAGHRLAALQVRSACRVRSWERGTPPATRHHHPSSRSSRKYGEKKRGVFQGPFFPQEQDSVPDRAPRQPQHTLG